MTARLPLAHHEVLHVRDPAVAREQVQSVFGPHHLEVVGNRADFEARHHRVQLGPLALDYLDYTAPVRIIPQQRAATYRVQIPLAGAGETVSGHQRVASTPTRAAVISADQRAEMQWRADSPHLIVSLDRAAMETTLRQTLGHPPEQPLLFHPGLDLTEPRVRRWMATLALVRREIDDDLRVATHPVSQRHLYQLVMTELLVAAQHSHSQLVHAMNDRAMPPVVRRAMELIEARAADPLTVDDVARGVGAGVRSLQQGFRAYLDTTPMAYLRRIRLQRVRAELLAASPHTDESVTDAAFRWGFVHSGRFAQAYRSAYGEPPSATLRRCPG